jgi:general secretion pathway protein L
MQKTLFIRLGMTPDEGVGWFTRDENTAPVSGSGELREAALRGQGAKVVVLAPASQMITTEVSLPALHGAKLRQALPYALEEQFADEVESLHFAVGKRDAEGRYPVLALERGLMEQWQGLFAEAELRPHVVLNECLAMPWREGEWSLLLRDDEAWLRISACQGYAIPLAELTDWLALALQGSEESPSAIRLFDARSEQSPWRSAPIGVEVHEERVDSLLALLARVDSGQGINLLQGDFSRKEQLGRLWRPWRATAALLGIWLLFQGGTDIEQVYRETFPEARNVVNPRIQMERKLEELKGGGSANAFVTLLTLSGPVLKKVEGLQLRNLRYKQGELELELELKDLPSLDSLKQSLQEKRLAVDVRGASTRNDRVESRIALREGGA